MKSLKTMMLFCFVFLFSFSGKAQEKPNSISLSFLKEKTGQDFSDLINPIQTPLYFGSSVAYHLERKQRDSYRFSHVFQLGYYHHKRVHQNLFLMWKPTYEFVIKNKIAFRLFPGIGYSHTFPTQATFAFENGEYVQKTNFGKGHPMMSAGFGIGYVFEKEEQPYEFFLNSELGLLLPYSRNGDLPVYINSIFSLGLKMPIKF